MNISIFKVGLIIFTSMLILAGCTGKIVRVELAPGTQVVCDTTFNTPCGVTDTQPVKIRIWGEGKCDSVGLKTGDGDTLFGPYQFDFGKAGATVPIELTHTYALAWPGIKTLHAYSASNCLGEAFETIRVMRKNGTAIHADFTLAFAQPPVGVFGQPIGPGPCSFVPNVRPLRTNTKISVTTNPDPNIKINFGCALGGCIYGADGEQGSMAPSTFPFKDFAKYSLILKVGSQIVQGGSRVAFTTNQAGPLEVCVNDDVLSDNTGAWGITFAVDESQAP